MEEEKKGGKEGKMGYDRVRSTLRGGEEKGRSGDKLRDERKDGVDRKNGGITRW